MNDSLWWKSDVGSDVHVTIFGHVEELETATQAERWEDRLHEAIYDDQPVGSPRYGKTVEHLASMGIDASRLNVSKNAVDTIVSKIATKNPGVKVNPTDAEWSLKLKSRQLNQFIKGFFLGSDFNEQDDVVVADACRIGTGITSVYSEDGNICIERIRKEEIFIDPLESRYGKPRQLHHRRMYAREVLAELYPEHRGAIMLANAAKDIFERSSEVNDNMIWVIKSWHLPSGPDADDGRYAMCIDGATLEHEEYKRTRFPFAFLPYTPPINGFWGKGIVAEGRGLQIKINDQLAKIEENLAWAKLTILKNAKSRVLDSHLGSLRPNVVEYEGVEPKFSAPNTVPAQLFQYLTFLVDSFYETLGISRMHAQAQAPGSLSGIALQEHYDITSERYASFEQRYARYRVDVAELVIDEAKALAEQDGGYEASWMERNLMRKIKWEKVDMKRDQFKLVLEATNFLPDTRAGKLSAAEQLAKAGVIRGRWVGALLGDHPDLDRFTRVNTAMLDLIDHHMELLADPEEKDAPVPTSFMPLDDTIEIAKSVLARAEIEGAGEDVIERYVQYIEMAEALKQKGVPAPQLPLPGMGAGAPPAEGPLPPGPAPVALEGAALPGVQ